MSCNPVSLSQALQQIAEYIKVDPVDLHQYALEDTIGGFHADESLRKWPTGSLWAVEGQVLYALVRALKPRRVLELGTYHGCSATHIASALKANGGGELVCVDNGVDAPNAPSIGYLIPDNLLDYISLANQDILEFLKRDDLKANGFDFIFEDGMHNPEQIGLTWEKAGGNLLMGTGVIVSHDACHFLVGNQVQDSIRTAGINDFQTYLIAPSDCGLAIKQFIKTPVFGETWRKYEGMDSVIVPGYIQTADGDTLEIVDAPPAETIKEKPKRGRKPKAK